MKFYHLFSFRILFGCFGIVYVAIKIPKLHSDSGWHGRMDNVRQNDRLSHIFEEHSVDKCTLQPNSEQFEWAQLMFFAE